MSASGKSSVKISQAWVRLAHEHRDRHLEFGESRGDVRVGFECFARTEPRAPAEHQETAGVRCKRVIPAYLQRRHRSSIKRGLGVERLNWIELARKRLDGLTPHGHANPVRQRPSRVNATEVASVKHAERHVQRGDRRVAPTCRGRGH
jgi:hypothetical protein